MTITLESLLVEPEITDESVDLGDIALEASNLLIEEADNYTDICTLENAVSIVVEDAKKPNKVGQFFRMILEKIKKGILAIVNFFKRFFRKIAIRISNNQRKNLKNWVNIDPNLASELMEKYNSVPVERMYNVFLNMDHISDKVMDLCEQTKPIPQKVKDLMEKVKKESEAARRSDDEMDDAGLGDFIGNFGGAFGYRGTEKKLDLKGLDDVKSLKGRINSSDDASYDDIESSQHGGVLTGKMKSLDDGIILAQLVTNTNFSKFCFEMADRLDKGFNDLSKRLISF